MNRRGFLTGLLAGSAIIPTVSTRTIVDLAKNTWRRPSPWPVTDELVRVSYWAEVGSGSGPGDWLHWVAYDGTQRVSRVIHASTTGCTVADPIPPDARSVNIHRFLSEHFEGA